MTILKRCCAQRRGFAPACAIFDSWYASLPNLKLSRSFGWRWLTRLKENRQVDPDNQGNRPLHQVRLSADGAIVHLKGYGFIKVFRVVAPDGDIEYWATNDREMNALGRLKFAELGWMIETYHRGIKQVVGIERCQARSAIAQRNHIALSKASPGMKRKRLSSVMLCGLTLPTRFTHCQVLILCQLRNS